MERKAGGDLVHLNLNIKRRRQASPCTYLESLLVLREVPDFALQLLDCTLWKRWLLFG